MNADGSRGVDTGISAGADFPILSALAWGSVGGGLVAAGRRRAADRRGHHRAAPRAGPLARPRLRPCGHDARDPSRRGRRRPRRGGSLPASARCRAARRVDPGGRARRRGRARLLRLAHRRGLRAVGGRGGRCPRRHPRARRASRSSSSTSSRTAPAAASAAACWPWPSASARRGCGCGPSQLEHGRAALLRAPRLRRGAAHRRARQRGARAGHPLRQDLRLRRSGRWPRRRGPARRGRGRGSCGS